MKLCGFDVGLNHPFFLIAGTCSIEGLEMSIEVAGRLKEACSELGIPLIYKGSFDKANRSSGNTQRGVGIDAGLKILDEVRRQIELIEDGGTVIQETRLYDPDRGETRSMRSKEDANDYRYFPDPDLLPVVIDDAWIADVRSRMPALPAQLREQWQADYGLSAYDTQLLTQDRDTAKVFEELLAIVGKPLAKAVANLIAGEFASSLNRAGIATANAPLKAVHLAPLLTRVADGTISNKIAKDIFAILWEEAVAGKAISSVDQVIDAKGLKQISDSGAIEAIIDQVLAANQKSVEEFRSGKEKAFNALVGQIMKASQGKANPGQVNELLRKKLS
jgi:aspartyl-tRNA(Asn)/glutamyl-tRNA(Gln) amidotransferase subunit B